MPYQVNHLDTIAAFLDDSHAGIAARAAAFRKSSLRRPDPEDDATARAHAPALIRDMAAAGLFDRIAETDLRGICLTREALAGASSLADTLFAVQALTALPLLAAGSATQKAAWLDPLLSGAAIGAFAMTEPGAGSDVAAIATTARRDGASWVLDGEKHLISNAGLADVYLVFASTSPDGERRRISLFLVPAETPGLSFGGPQVTAAPHPLGRIRFDACRVAEDALVDEEGTGFALGLSTLDRLRPSVGAAACGMAGRALAAAIRHTAGRSQFGTTLASMPVVRDTLARMATDLDAARLLVYRAAHRADTVNGRNTLAAAMAKSFATETAQRIVDDALQLCGGVGLLAGHPVERLYRSVRGLRVYEGTTEIQRVAIARELLDS
ncbi:MAG: acyl-CoA dehydrogenase family protein [Vicinamibacterales bacterium]